MVSDKALAHHCVEMNFHLETDCSETSKVFIRRKMSTVGVDRHRQAHRVMPSWFESLLGDVSSGFPLASHLASPGSKSVFGIARGPPMCAHSS